MGSAKDVIITEKPAKNQLGNGIFIFKDDYSVFDFVKYGFKMPSGISGKGKALWNISTGNFKTAETFGIKTHYTGGLEPNVMGFKAAEIYSGHVHAPEFRLGFLYDKPKDAHSFVIPIEVIYRNELGPESSVMKKLKSGEIKPEDVGLSAIPEGGQLDSPIITYTTKFEPNDQFITRSEAQLISGLEQALFDTAEKTASAINHILNQQTIRMAKHYKIDLRHPDGKCELLIHDGKILVGDVFGTPDEDRFEIILKDGAKMKMSKQVIRDFYEKTQWYPKFREWQKKADEVFKERGVKTYNELEDQLTRRAIDESTRLDVGHLLPPTPQPPEMPAELKKYAEDVYRIFADIWFAHAKMKDVKQLQGDFRTLVETGIIK